MTQMKTLAALAMTAILFVGCGKDNKPDFGLDVDMRSEKSSDASQAPVAASAEKTAADKAAADKAANSKPVDKVVDADAKAAGDGKKDSTVEVVKPANKLLDLRASTCAKPVKDTCKVKGLEVPPDIGGYCPYETACVGGACSLKKISAGFCNCIYQLSMGRSHFDGKDHNCVAEYKDASAALGK